MALVTGITVINSKSIGRLLQVAAEEASEQVAIPVLLAISFEYSLLMPEQVTDEERQEMRSVTLQEARGQAKEFHEEANKVRRS